MNFIVIVATMAAFWHRGSTESSSRQGKFLGMSSEDMFGDILDEVNDPLPIPVNSVSVRTRIMQKLRQETDSKKKEEIPPIPLPEQLVQKLSTTAPIVPANTVLRPSGKPFRKINITNHVPEPLILYDTSTSKFEILPPGFASQPPPITESMFVFGGQFGQQKPANVTDQKIFWSSVGDFIEAVPFLPIQVNVPDLLQAMASFFTQRIPLVNRFTNPNEPRPQFKLPTSAHVESLYTDLPAANNLLEYRKMRPAVKSATKPKKSKRRKPSRKKPVKRSTTEAYRIRGNHLGVTAQPKITNVAKNWFEKKTEAPIAHTTEELKFFNRKSTKNEQVKYKNMPFTREVTRYADKEMFNFKHSDISNSPIMILNMPHRPVVMYKVKSEQKSEVPFMDSGHIP